MAERFTEALGKQLFIWSGWVFTVGGAIGSFVLGQGYAWIGWLTVAVGLLAVTGHAIAMHRRVHELGDEHKKRVDELEEANRKLTEQAAEAERRLNAVPMAVLERLARLASASTTAEVMEAVIGHLRRVERIRRFTQLDARPLNPRTFAYEDGRLYAIARLTPPERAAMLEIGDSFQLVRRGANGVAVECARLRVHQPPSAGTVIFEVIDPTGGEMTALGRLAESSREVAGITNYFVQPTTHADGYPVFDPDVVAEVIRRVFQELRTPGGVT